MLNFLILLFAMSASGAIGFYLARERYLGDGKREVRALGAELAKLRRRSQSADAQTARLKTECDRLKRATRKS